jgi:uncharacterized membrane protein
MSVLLVLLAFILIMVGVATQIVSHNSDTKFAVTWTTIPAAFCFLLFAAKVYFT